jgi:hypothetical protein
MMKEKEKEEAEEKRKQNGEEEMADRQDLQLTLNITMEGLVLPKFQSCDFSSCDKYTKKFLT